MKHIAVDALRVFIVAAVAFLLLVQAVVLPGMADDQARAAAELAFLRTPLLVLCVLGIACVQVVLVCTWHLLTMTERGEVFSDRARPWVDAIIVALTAGSVVGVGTGTWLGSVDGVGPLTVIAGPVLIGGASGAAALLMGVMRSLLVRATEQRAELEQVV